MNTYKILNNLNKDVKRTAYVQGWRYGTNSLQIYRDLWINNSYEEKDGKYNSDNDDEDAGIIFQ